MINATVAYSFDIGADRSVEVHLRGPPSPTNSPSPTSFGKHKPPLRGRNLALGVRHRFGGFDRQDVLPGGKGAAS